MAKHVKGWRERSVRECAVCSRKFAKDGPTPYCVDWHWAGDRMVLTCSPTCRRAGGYPERKAAPIPVYDKVQAERAASLADWRTHR